MLNEAMLNTEPLNTNGGSFCFDVAPTFSTSFRFDVKPTFTYPNLNWLKRTGQPVNWSRRTGSPKTWTKRR